MTESGNDGVHSTCFMLEDYSNIQKKKDSAHVKHKTRSETAWYLGTRMIAQFTPA